MNSKKLLIVEDRPGTRIPLVLHFSLEGYEVIAAENGLEGLKKTLEHFPDLIITDINMPKMSGIDMVKRLREEEQFKRLPIIAMTIHGNNFAEAARDAGADVFLHKTTPLSPINSVVEQLLQ